jgi:hypothetical protein
MFVALGNPACAMLLCVACLAVQYFPNDLKKGKIF